MSNEVNLRVNDIKNLVAWLEERKLLDKNYPVSIETKNSNGIGTAIQVYIETAEGEGLYKDLTDYGSW
jgi:hypothetical protein